MIPLGSTQKNAAKKTPSPASKPSGNSQADRDKLLQEAIQFAQLVVDEGGNIELALSQASDPDQRALLGYFSEINTAVSQILNGRDMSVQIRIEEINTEGLFRASSDAATPDTAVIGEGEIDKGLNLIRDAEGREAPGHEGEVRDEVVTQLAGTLIHELAHAVNYQRGSSLVVLPVLRSADEAKAMARELAENRATDEALAEIYAALLTTTSSGRNDYFNRMVHIYLVTSVLNGRDGVSPTHGDLFKAFFEVNDDPANPNRYYHFDDTDVPYWVGYFKVREHFRTYDNCAAEPEACLNSIVDLIDPPSDSEFFRGGRYRSQRQTAAVGGGGVGNTPFRRRVKEERVSPGKKERGFDPIRDREEARRTDSQAAATRDKVDRAQDKKDSSEVRRRREGDEPVAGGDRPTARSDDRSDDRNRNRRRGGQGTKPNVYGDKAFWRPAARPGQDHQAPSGGDVPGEESPQQGAPSAENRPGGASADSGTPIVPGPGGGGVPSPRTNQEDNGSSKVIFRHISSRDNEDGTTTHHGYLEREDGTMEEVDITCRGASCADQNGRTYQPQHEDGTPMTDQECNGNCGFQDGTALVPISTNNNANGNGGNNGNDGNAGNPDNSNDCVANNNCPAENADGTGGKINPNVVPSIITVGGVVMIRGVGVSQDRIDPLCFRAKCPQRNGNSGGNDPGAASDGIQKDPCDDPAAHCGQGQGGRREDDAIPVEQNSARDPNCQKDGCPGYGQGPRDGNVPSDIPGSNGNLGVEGDGSGANPKVSKGQTGGNGSRGDRSERKQERPAVKPTGR